MMKLLKLSSNNRKNDCFIYKYFNEFKIYTFTFYPFLSQPSNHNPNSTVASRAYRYRGHAQTNF